MVVYFGGGGDTAVLHPGYRSNIHYGSFLASDTQARRATVADTLYFIPFHVAHPVVIDQLGCHVTSTTAGANVRLGVYKNSGGQPTDLVVDGGESASAEPGAVTITLSENLHLDTGHYWFALVSNTTPFLRSFTAGNPLGLFGRTAVDQQPTRAYSQSHTYGALPTTASSLTADQRNENQFDITFVPV